VSRSSRKGAPGHAMGLRRGTASGSCCWRPTAAWRRPDRARQRQRDVERVGEGQKGGARAAAGLEATRGSYQSRKWRRQSCSDGELRQRRQPAASGSGGGVARSGKASRREVRRWAGLGATRGVQGRQVGASGGAARRPAATLRRGRGEAEEEEGGNARG
jgi:hypothetical protein